MKITNAMMTKSTIGLEATPYFISTGLPAGSVPIVTARSLKFTPEGNKPIGGMMMFSTSAETILPNAAPMTTPTARSMTLPLIGKFFEF